MKRKAAVNAPRFHWERVFAPESRERLGELVDIDLVSIPEFNEEATLIDRLRGAEVVLGTWGMLPFTENILQACPDLKLILYGAGSPKGFVTPALIESGVTVCTAVHINARPVAEFVLGLILSSMKHVYLHKAAFVAEGPAAWRQHHDTLDRGYYRTRVGLLGWGRITRILVELLAPFDFTILVADKYLTAEEAARHGVNPASIGEVMSTCDVVSLHHANIPEHKGMINRSNLELLKPGARFINTSRGALVNEDDLVARLQKGDITAFLDVTDPEPPIEGHPFYTLPNCFLTPHIAGSLGTETQRMGRYCVRELENFLEGRPLENPIDLRRLDRYA